jgi:hypothetical protein
MPNKPTTPLTDSEYFEKVATIDACYFMISQAQAELNKKQAPLIAAIDSATGYERHRIRSIARSVKGFIRQIIALKKEIGFTDDEAHDQEALNSINAFLTTTLPQSISQVPLPPLADRQISRELQRKGKAGTAPAQSSPGEGG